MKAIDLHPRQRLYVVYCTSTTKYNAAHVPWMENDSKALPLDDTQFMSEFIITFLAPFHSRNASSLLLRVPTAISLDAAASIPAYGFFCNLSRVCNLFRRSFAPHQIKHASPIFVPAEALALREPRCNTLSGRKFEKGEDTRLCTFTLSCFSGSQESRSSSRSARPKRFAPCRGRFRDWWKPATTRIFRRARRVSHTAA